MVTLYDKIYPKMKQIYVYRKVKWRKGDSTCILKRYHISWTVNLYAIGYVILSGCTKITLTLQSLGGQQDFWFNLVLHMCKFCLHIMPRTKIIGVLRDVGRIFLYFHIKPGKNVPITFVWFMQMTSNLDTK